MEKAKAESETKFFDLRERRKRYDGHSDANMSLDEVKVRIEECNDDIEDINKKLGGLKDSIYSKLSDLGLTPDLTYWTKFNPDLLMTPGEITSELELMREIKSLSDATGISLPGIEAVPQSLTKLESTDSTKLGKPKFKHDQKKVFGRGQMPISALAVLWCLESERFARRRRHLTNNVRFAFALVITGRRPWSGIAKKYAFGRRVAQHPPWFSE